MSNDAQFLVMLAPQANMLWAAPIQIIASFTLLGLLLGPSFLAGVFMIFLFVPLQKKLATKLFLLRKQVLGLTDERVKLVNEVIQGIRVVKLYAWEDSLRKKIDTVRQRELQIIRTQRTVGAAFSMILGCQPLFITCATFTVYSLAGNELDAPTVRILHTSSLHPPRFAPSEPNPCVET